MVEIHANDNFDASIDDVFAVVSDHQQFLRGGGITKVDVTPGPDSKNGLGAVREVFAGPLHFVEEVVNFEPPHRYDYRILSLKFGGVAMPMRHDGGWLQLQEAAGLVRLDWFSRFELDVPLVGRALARRAARNLTSGFNDLLRQAKSDIARRG